MATVAIGECMYPHQLVMETHRKLLRTKHLMHHLMAGVVQQIVQLHSHLRPIHANVFVAFAKRTVMWTPNLGQVFKWDTV